MTLLPSNVAILRQASSVTIESIFIDLEPNLLQGRFLSTQNYLGSDTVKTLEKQFSKKPRKRKKFLSRYTGEYISSSSILHNLDAWKYLGRAINSLLNGDKNSARHLLYYCELRAAMSFLATQGIGIFNNRHISIDSNSKAKVINFRDPAKPNWDRNEIGTHSFAWDALESFMQNQLNLSKIFNNYTVEGYPMNLWLELFNVLESFRNSLAKDLLTKLTFDIGAFSNDRNARNEASYRPSGVENILDFGQDLRDVRDIWRLSQPSNIKGEISLDHIILAELLQMAFKATQTSNKSYKQANRQFRQRITIMLDGLGIQENRKQELYSIFLQDHSHIFEYLNLKDRKHPSFTKGMLYRSFFFLRLSNVFCKKLLREANNVDKEILEFWWKPLGLNGGLWEADNDPLEFADLWQDVADATQNFESNVDQNAHPTDTYSFWRQNNYFGFTLSTCSRIGLWGLGL